MRVICNFKIVKNSNKEKKCNTFGSFFVVITDQEFFSIF